MAKFARRKRLQQSETNESPAADIAAPSHFKSFVPFILFLSVFAAFFPALTGQWVWDDRAISENALVAAADGLYKIWFEPSKNAVESHYWPLTYTTFWFEHRLWGNHPAGYHFVNVFLHALNAILFLWILRRSQSRGSEIAALVFALHPIHVESVAWAIERKDVLSGLFYLASLYAWIRAKEESRPAFHALGILALILAMLSKSMAISLPFALAFWSIWRDGRLKKNDALYLIPYLLVAVAMGAFDAHFANGSESYDSGMSFVDRLQFACRAVAFYSAKLFFPFELTTIYPLWTEATSKIALGVLACAVIIGIAIARNRARLSVALSVAFYVVALGPVLGMLDFGYLKISPVADRFQYLPSLAPIAAFGWIASGLGSLGIQKTGNMKWLSCGILVFLLGLSTYEQTRRFSSSRELFTDVLRKNPHAASAHHGLAVINAKDGKLEDALKGYRKAIECDERFLLAYLNLGELHLVMGNENQAVAVLRQGLFVDPNYIPILYTLGNAEERRGHSEGAIEVYERVVKLAPDFALAYGSLARVLFYAGRSREAMQRYDEALKIAPDLPEALVGKGMLYYSLGEQKTGQAMIEKGIALKPELKSWLTPPTRAPQPKLPQLP